MSNSFFFYDLETSGISARSARIMQFAGQRTSLDLQPLEEPHSYFIQLTEDVLPDPEAILLTGITPQKTKADGMGEADFLRLFHEQIAKPGTIFVGFNSIRFDDEFIRFLHWRNFYDAYEWHWLDGSGRWDILDVVRMTRALRPDGIKWPFDSSGKAANRLGLLTSINKLDHTKAHDAASDVEATIAVARLIRNKQTKLFDYLFSIREKDKVAALVNAGQPFVYTSGKYSSEFEKTTVVTKLVDHPKRQAALVYDLRHDPTGFLELTPEQLVERWQWQKEPTDPRLPIKTLRFNVCPAIAPLGVLDEDSKARLQINMSDIEKNQKILEENSDFKSQVLKALALMDKQQQTRLLEDVQDVDGQLYDGFVGDKDKTKMSLVRATSADELATLNVSFDDDRLNALLPLYKARNYPKSLTVEEQGLWEKYRESMLLHGGTHSLLLTYMNRVQELGERKDLSSEQRYILEELNLYAQSIMPLSGDALS